MADYYEIDFLAVETKKSGDAIAMRYCQNGVVTIHVTDGGFQETGNRLVDHINEYYGNPTEIDHVVVTHNDGDHTAGLLTVLESFKVNKLWMLRPWRYSSELLDRFRDYRSVESLELHLREVYANLAMIENLAQEKHISIGEPFQGTKIGEFIVTSPKKERFLNLIVESDRTGRAATEKSLGGKFSEALTAAQHWLKSQWGLEVFSTNSTSEENEMSIVQFGELCGKRVLLTGDTGRSGLRETIDFLRSSGTALPGFDFFQVPHHGSRRNVDSDVLDALLGSKYEAKPQEDEIKFVAYISSAAADKDHPRQCVVAAMMHRGARVYPTEGMSLCHRSPEAPQRAWDVATPAEYPDNIESES